MPAWMVYAVVVSGLIGLASAAAERVLRLYDLPTRGAWALAMGASVTLPIAAWLGGGPPATVAALPLLGVGETLSRLGGAVAGEAASDAGTGIPALDNLVLWGWALASGAGLLWLGYSALHLHRAMKRTPTRSVGDVDVHLTVEEGPACWAFPGFRARVLLPTWLRELTPERRRLAVAHEREHLRRGDSLLTATGCLLLAAAPWNLPLWWQLRRLRRAVELDCDARVLDAGAEPRSYGDLLLTVGGRAGNAAWSALPLSEGADRIERRIRAMTTAPQKHRFWKAGLLAVVALAAGALAAETAPPGATGSDVGGEASVAERESRPKFIPFSEAPELQNPQTVRRRLGALYPDSLRRAGIGGTVVLRIYIDTSGEVQRSRVEGSSGHQALDRAALGVVDAMEFSPALNRDQARAVWIQQRVQFQPPSTGETSPAVDASG